MVTGVESGRILPIQESLDLSSPLSVGQFSEMYPYVLRSLSHPGEEFKQIHCLPQSGEWETYGVFFYPLRDGSQIEKAFWKGRLNILVDTNELMNSAGIGQEIRDRGVVVNPSSFFQKLYQDEARKILGSRPNYDTKSVGFYCDAAGAIYKRNLVLNTSRVRLGQLPVFTIPCAVHLDRRMLRVIE